jgi:hypothetical protein
MSYIRVLGWSPIDALELFCLVELFQFLVNFLDDLTLFTLEVDRLNLNKHPKQLLHIC